MGEIHNGVSKVEENDKERIAVRLVWLDYYMTKPNSQFDDEYSSLYGTSVDSVPVLRIFGSTVGGQKVCLHVHRVLPYFFVKMEKRVETQQELEGYLRSFADQIDRAMNLSFGRGGGGFRGQGGVPSSSSSRIGIKSFLFDILVVQGNPFYGFQPTSQVFLKILYRDPKHTTRLVQLLWEGAVTGKRVESYEAHIPLNLQFLLDFRLYGMGLIHIRKPLFRLPFSPPMYAKEKRTKREKKKRKNEEQQTTMSSSSSDGSQSKSLPQTPHIEKPTSNSPPTSQSQSNFLWKEENLQRELISPLEHQSTCELEIDVCPEDILNPLDHPLDFSDGCTRNEVNLTATTPSQQKGGQKKDDSVPLAAPRCQLIRSLAEIWDEERKRREKSDNKIQEPLGRSPSPPRCLPGESFFRSNPGSHEKLRRILEKDKQHLLAKQQIEGESSVEIQPETRPNEQHDKAAGTLESIASQQQTRTSGLHLPLFSQNLNPSQEPSSAAPIVQPPGVDTSRKPSLKEKDAEQKEDQPDLDLEDDDDSDDDFETELSLLDDLDAASFLERMQNLPDEHISFLASQLSQPPLSLGPLDSDLPHRKDLPNLEGADKAENEEEICSDFEAILRTNEVFSGGVEDVVAEKEEKEKSSESEKMNHEDDDDQSSKENTNDDISPLEGSQLQSRLWDELSYLSQRISFVHNTARMQEIETLNQTLPPLGTNGKGESQKERRKAFDWTGKHGKEAKILYSSILKHQKRKKRVDKILSTSLDTSGDPLEPLPNTPHHSLSLRDSSGLLSDPLKGNPFLPWPPPVVWSPPFFSDPPPPPSLPHSPITNPSSYPSSFPKEKGKTNSSSLDHPKSEHSGDPKSSSRFVFSAFLSESSAQTPFFPQHHLSKEAPPFDSQSQKNPCNDGDFTEDLPVSSQPSIQDPPSRVQSTKRRKLTSTTTPPPLPSPSLPTSIVSIQKSSTSQISSPRRTPPPSPHSSPPSPHSSPPSPHSSPPSPHSSPPSPHSSPKKDPRKRKFGFRFSVSDYETDSCDIPQLDGSDDRSLKRKKLSLISSGSDKSVKKRLVDNDSCSATRKSTYFEGKRRDPSAKRESTKKSEESSLYKSGGMVRRCGDWVLREARSYQGKCYWQNQKTLVSRWDTPKEVMEYDRKRSKEKMIREKKDEKKRKKEGKDGRKAPIASVEEPSRGNREVNKTTNEEKERPIKRRRNDDEETSFESQAISNSSFDIRSFSGSLSVVPRPNPNLFPGRIHFPNALKPPRVIEPPQPPLNFPPSHGLKALDFRFSNRPQDSPRSLVLDDSHFKVGLSKKRMGSSISAPDTPKGILVDRNRRIPHQPKKVTWDSSVVDRPPSLRPMLPNPQHRPPSPYPLFQSPPPPPLPPSPLLSSSPPSPSLSPPPFSPPCSPLTSLSVSVLPDPLGDPSSQTSLTLAPNLLDQREISEEDTSSSSSKGATGTQNPSSESPILVKTPESLSEEESDEERSIQIVDLVELKPIPCVKSFSSESESLPQDPSKSSEGSSSSSINLSPPSPYQSEESQTQTKVQFVPQIYVGVRSQSPTPESGTQGLQWFSRSKPPPKLEDLVESLEKYKVLPVVYEEPFYEDDAAGPSSEGGRRRVTFGCMEYQVKIKGFKHLPRFWDRHQQQTRIDYSPSWNTSLSPCRPTSRFGGLGALETILAQSRKLKCFTRVRPPPPLSEVLSWDDPLFVSQMQARGGNDSNGKTALEGKQEESPQGGGESDPSVQKLIDFFTEKAKRQETEQQVNENGGEEKKDDKNVQPQTKKEKADMPTTKAKKLPRSLGKKIQSQIEGASDSSPDFDCSLSQSKEGSEHLSQHLTIMSLEVHVLTKENLLPNPATDPIGGVAYCVRDDDDIARVGEEFYEEEKGMIVVRSLSSDTADEGMVRADFISGIQVTIVESEVDLFDAIIRLIRDYYDIDILCSFDVQSFGLGFLCERAVYIQPPRDLCRSLSRYPSNEDGLTRNTNDDGTRFGDERGGVDGGKKRGRRAGPGRAGEDDGIRGGAGVKEKGLSVRITGRLIMNVWKIIRSEVKTNQYSFHSSVYNVMHLRIPDYPFSHLTKWWTEGQTENWKGKLSKGERRVIEYVTQKASLTLGMLTKLDVISRTSEQARVFGVEFENVAARGSQYRVEAMMLRVTKPLNYILLSPTREQVAKQAAPECFALTMEPESRFYTSPVLVLDFRSLYPSIMIAYNLCYSTCLGKISHHRKKTLGVTNFEIPEGLMGLLGDERIFLAPNDVAYVKKDVRAGVLPRMLSDILETRFMVKQAMKGLTKDQKNLRRILNARQFALKMVANVTYGYAGASFSGRMPCADLADSIVEIARRVLEASIRMVEKEKEWGATVVYGDSVTSDTPILCRSTDEKGVQTISLRPISQLPRGGWILFPDGKGYSIPLNNLEVWSDKGFTKIKKIMRHQTDKKIYRVTSHTGVVKVTEDHSLLYHNGTEVRPKDVFAGENLLTSTLPSIDGTVDHSDISWVWGLFYGDGSCGYCDCLTGKKYTWAINNQNGEYLSKAKEILQGYYSDYGFKILETMKKSSSVYKLVPTGKVSEIVEEWRSLFYDPETRHKMVPNVLWSTTLKTREEFFEGYYCAGGEKGENGPTRFDNKGDIGSAGLFYLGISLGYKASCNTRKDNLDITRITLTKSYQRKKPGGIIKKIEDFGQTGDYVYDLETENHHFSAGIGELVVHNTDSLFVHLPGRSRAEAFRIGKEISRRVTEMNPSPIKLQFEKVYHPCLLVSKKRYVGMKYEHPNQTEPIYDAKGIETVRRDSCPAVQKIEEKCLRILFQTQNLSEIRRYLERQWSKILTNRTSLRDFVFSKEVRLGTYRALPPPAALVALKKMATDPRASPHYGQRIPYVVVAGTKNSRLSDLVVDPEAFLASGQFFQINSKYYIEKQILPALSRLLNLAGADVVRWFQEMPRYFRLSTKQRVLHNETLNFKTKKTIDQYYQSKGCVICSQEAQPKRPICERCDASPQTTALAFMNHIRELDLQKVKLDSICGSCVAGRGDVGIFSEGELVKTTAPTTSSTTAVSGIGGDACQSIDCEIFFIRLKNKKHLSNLRKLEVDLYW